MYYFLWGGKLSHSTIWLKNNSVFWPSFCLTYCLCICWFCLFHFLLLYLHWLYWFCLYLDANFYLVWTGFTKHKSLNLVGFILVILISIKWFMGNLVFIRIVEETILTFNGCWIPNLFSKETEVTTFCFAGIKFRFASQMCCDCCLLLWSRLFMSLGVGDNHNA